MMLFHIDEAVLDASYIDEIRVDLHGCGTAHVSSAPSLALASIIKPHSIANPSRRVVVCYRFLKIDATEPSFAERQSF
jgi:alanyl-tRNA synthetase